MAGVVGVKAVVVGQKNNIAVGLGSCKVCNIILNGVVALCGGLHEEVVEHLEVRVLTVGFVAVVVVDYFELAVFDGINGSVIGESTVAVIHLLIADLPAELGGNFVAVGYLGQAVKVLMIDHKTVGDRGNGHFGLLGGGLGSGAGSLRCVGLLGRFGSLRGVGSVSRGTGRGCCVTAVTLLVA